MSAMVDTGKAINEGPIAKWLRDGLFAQMEKLRHGRLILRDAYGVRTFGSADDEEDALTVHLHIHDVAFYRAVVANGSVGAGEAYMDGFWSCDDLVSLVRLLVRNRDLLDGMESGLARLGGLAMRVWHGLRRNTREGSRRNIAAHYDLGNEFFRLFLSSDLMYSSALWVDDDDTLEIASTRKLQRICEQLDLKATDHVVEIGTGWGGFALYASMRYGCRITTTTISREQHALATARIHAAGLADKVTVLLKDYRDLEGQYDKLVSIEMVEAIGAEYLDVYFSKVSRLLKSGGLALLQAITIEDHRYEKALASVDFIKRHIFPGSFIPSIHALIDSKAHSSDLSLIGLWDFGFSYARTLQSWRVRFLEKMEQVRELGFDDRFTRMWEFYLAYCEGGFRERSIGVSHLLLAKPGYRPAQRPSGSKLS